MDTNVGLLWLFIYEFKVFINWRSYEVILFTLSPFADRIGCLKWHTVGLTLKSFNVKLSKRFLKLVWKQTWQELWHIFVIGRSQVYWRFKYSFHFVCYKTKTVYFLKRHLHFLCTVLVISWNYCYNLKKEAVFVLKRWKSNTATEKCSQGPRRLTIHWIVGLSVSETIFKSWDRVDKP